MLKRKLNENKHICWTTDQSLVLYKTGIKYYKTLLWLSSTSDGEVIVVNAESPLDNWFSNFIYGIIFWTYEYFLHDVAKYAT